MQEVSTHEIVVARYKEDVSWLLKLPDWKITIYNKGPADIPESVTTAAHIEVVSLENKGREAETYAYHMLHRYDSFADLTIFIQADPFDHSPELVEAINVLRRRQTFSDKEKYIPIATRYNETFPPKHIVDRRKNRFYRIEDFSVYTLDCLEHIDPIGAPWISAHWYKQYVKPSGTNIMKYFFDSISWPHTFSADLLTIKFSYAACFALTKPALLQFDKSFYESLYPKTFDQHIAPWILERAWLHMFDPAFSYDNVLPEHSIDPAIITKENEAEICTEEVAKRELLAKAKNNTMLERKIDFLTIQWLTMNRKIGERGDALVSLNNILQKIYDAHK